MHLRWAVAVLGKQIPHPRIKQMPIENINDNRHDGELDECIRIRVVARHLLKSCMHDDGAKVLHGFAINDDGSHRHIRVELATIDAHSVWELSEKSLLEARESVSPSTLSRRNVCTSIQIVGDGLDRFLLAISKRLAARSLRLPVMATVHPTSVNPCLQPVCKMLLNMLQLCCKPIIIVASVCNSLVTPPSFTKT